MSNSATPMLRKLAKPKRKSPKSPKMKRKSPKSPKSPKTKRAPLRFVSRDRRKSVNNRFLNPQVPDEPGLKTLQEVYITGENGRLEKKFIILNPKERELAVSNKTKNMVGFCYGGKRGGTRKRK